MTAHLTQDEMVDKAEAWDAVAAKNEVIAALRADLSAAEARATAAEAAIEHERMVMHAINETNARLLSLIADIREASGLGAKPMLDELPAAIGQIAEERIEAQATNHEVLGDFALTAFDLQAAEAALSQMKEALKRMHRRAQSAEGRVEAADSLLASWQQHPVTSAPAGYVASVVIKDARKALARRALAQQEGI